VSLSEPLRHPAETALIALHECADDQAHYVISLVAAKLYRELGVGIDAAYALFARMPDSASLRHLWFFWVKDGKFGGRADDAQDVGIFFAHMNDALRDGLGQFDPAMEHLERSYRSLVRSSRLEQVLQAVRVLTTAADRRYVGHAGLARQLSDALGSAEWQSLRPRPSGRSAAGPHHGHSKDESYALSLGRLTNVLNQDRRGPG
jgi:hypothetical protein